MIIRVPYFPVFSNFSAIYHSLAYDLQYNKIQCCPKHTTVSPNNLQASFSQTSLQLNPKLTVRVMSYSPGLVDFAIGQVNSVPNLLDGLVKLFGGEFK